MFMTGSLAPQHCRGNITEAARVNQANRVTWLAAFVT